MSPRWQLAEFPWTVSLVQSHLPIRALAEIALGFTHERRLCSICGHDACECEQETYTLQEARFLIAQAEEYGFGPVIYLGKYRTKIFPQELASLGLGSIPFEPIPVAYGKNRSHPVLTLAAIMHLWGDDVGIDWLPLEAIRHDAIIYEQDDDDPDDASYECAAIVDEQRLAIGQALEMLPMDVDGAIKILTRVYKDHRSA